jgi:hypothetical protein
MSTNTRTFTPGPWSPHRWTEHQGDWNITDPDGVIIASVTGRGGEFAEQDTANARLIAAAPCLLDALETFPGFTDDAAVGDRWIEKMRGAIARATGKEPA